MMIEERYLRCGSLLNIELQFTFMLHNYSTTTTISDVCMRNEDYSLEKCQSNK